MIRIAPGMYIKDVSQTLPRHPTKRYGKRRGKIDAIYIHHSGKLGDLSFQGLVNSTKYTIRAKDFPGNPYHYWVPWYYNATFFRLRWPLICYQANHDNVRTWHIGTPPGKKYSKPNSHGIAIGLQGNTTTKGMSDFQEEWLEALIPYLYKKHGLVGPECLRMHCEADEYGGKAKKSCPGKQAEEWIRAYRRDM